MTKALVTGLLTGLMLGCTKYEQEQVNYGHPIHNSPPPGMYNKISVTFNHKVGSTALEFGKAYAAPHGDTFYVGKFKYYISNIRLISDKDSVFCNIIDCPVIDASGNRTYTTVVGPGPLRFKAVSFMIGIDSARIVSGPLVGLKPYSTNDMYWNKDSGYIFLKLEGEVIRGTQKKPVTYHIGGFGGPFRAQREFLIPFNGIAETGLNRNPVVHLITDLEELLKTPNLVDVYNHSHQVTTGPGAKAFADNYADMISFQGIEH